MKAFGHNWESDGETLRAAVGRRYHVLTWPFGSIHQSKVVVSYRHATSEHTCCSGPSVGVGLQPGKTQKEAMRRGLDWVKGFQKKGPPGPEAVVAKCAKDYPDLFKSRDDVLEQLFFIGGCGFAWLDGALYDLSQEPPPDFSHLERTAKQAKALLAKTLKLLPPKQGRELQELLSPKPPPPKVFRLWDSGNLCRVPPDVKPAWRKLAVEAADLLLKRGDGPARKRAAQLRKKLLSV